MRKLQKPLKMEGPWTKECGRTHEAGRGKGKKKKHSSGKT
jgi:hypothetical protein